MSGFRSATSGRRNIGSLIGIASLVALTAGCAAATPDIAVSPSSAERQVTNTPQTVEPDATSECKPIGIAEGTVEPLSDSPALDALGLAAVTEDACAYDYHDLSLFLDSETAVLVFIKNPTDEQVARTQNLFSDLYYDVQVESTSTGRPGYTASGFVNDQEVTATGDLRKYSADDIESLAIVGNWFQVVEGDTVFMLTVRTAP